MKVPASLALLLPMVACTPAKTPAVTPARVFFVAPAEGMLAGDTVHIQLGAEGVKIVAATGKRVEEAHHHLFIDTDPTADTRRFPKNDAIRHLGTGADTISLVWHRARTGSLPWRRGASRPGRRRGARRSRSTSRPR
ncbi:MAG: DUF4399 domain-containing protein [Gemmatimonadetes bacterium]|nr:DUF4399 domain-containing protein [Gemmatimonadota bacterium]